MTVQIYVLYTAVFFSAYRLLLLTNLRHPEISFCSIIVLFSVSALRRRLPYRFEDDVSFSLKENKERRAMEEKAEERRRLREEQLAKRSAKGKPHTRALVVP